VLNAVPDAISVFGPDARLRYSNHASSALRGDEQGRHVGASLDAIAADFENFDERGGSVAPEQIPVRRALRGEQVTEVLGFRPRAGGPTRWIRVNARPGFGPDQKPRFAVTLVQDVTQARREAEARQFLLEAGILLSSSLDFEVTLGSLARLAVPRLADWCAVEVADEDAGSRSVAVAHADPNQLQVLRTLTASYPPDPGVPTGPSRVLRTGVAEVHNEIPDAALVAAAKDPEHLRLARALRLTAVMIVPMKAQGRVLGVISFGSAGSGVRFNDDDLAVATQLADLAAVAADNARLYAEARSARLRLELALQAGRMGTWELDATTGRFTWSRAFAALHGVEPRDLAPTMEGYLATIHPDDREAARASLRRTVEDGTEHRSAYRIVHPSHEDRWVEARGRVVRDSGGRALRLLGVRVDVTDRVLAEQRLTEERGWLAVTLASIGDAVIATDRDGRVTLINAVAEALTGWTMDAAVGRPLLDVFPIFSERTGLRVQNPVQRVLESGRVVGLDNHTALEARDGSRRSIADSAAPIRSADGRIIGVVLVFRDVTEAKRTEQELAKASKLESVGVLAGGIAHDFNNILAAIMANVSLAERRLAPDHPAQVRLQAALAASGRARDLTRQLLTFSRGGAPVKSATAVGDILREACAFALQGSSVRAFFAFAESVPGIDADAGQIAQVAHNLALNAVQAMPDGGHFRVDAATVVLDDGTWLPLPPGTYVRISFEDNGPGIASEHLGRIFDPFFTTKSQGSGLGLATAYSIVRRHDGHMCVESAPGRTTFTVYLPASSREVQRPAEEPAPSRRGRGRILVMDDDPLVRDLAGECLRELGYEPDFAPDGGEAIQRYADARASGRPFALIIADLTVPGGLGGREMIRRLKERFPDARAIVSSGYSNDPIMASFREHEFHGVLPKPFVIGDLARVLDEALHADER
jgi:PAS domain S-box-containing protein